MSIFKKNDYVCLCTYHSHGTLQIVENAYRDVVETRYPHDPSITNRARSETDFIFFCNFVRYILGDHTLVSGRTKKFLCAISRTKLNEMLLEACRKLTPPIIEDLYEELLLHSTLETAKEFLKVCSYVGSYMEQETTQSTQSKGNDMTKLYKIIKDDNGKDIKKPSEFGTYVASDGTYIMLRMESSTGDKPVIQAFLPDHIEEVKPWTFSAMRFGASKSSLFIGTKDMVSEGDIIISNKTGEMFRVTKTNTKSDIPNTDSYKFQGRRLVTEKIEGGADA